MEQATIEAVSNLAAVPFANVAERRRFIHHEVAPMRHQRICTADPNYDEAATIVGALACEPNSVKGAARGRACAARALDRSRAA